MKLKSETIKAKQLDTSTKALIFVDKDYFPNIYVILVISATLPVTSCECERTISMLKTPENGRACPSHKGSGSFPFIYM